MLKLVLQTEEGQQLEVSVGPEDTFANLQSQYESPENPGLPELLKHLITNGTEVDDDTKVFDYVTNSSSTEWLMEESLEDISGLESVDVFQEVAVQTLVKECCVKGCFNTEVTTPNKTFFSLPSDQERLSTWLIGIGRQELLEMVLQPGSEKYFVCGDHFTSNQFLKGTNQVLKRRACPSLPPSTTIIQTVSTSILKPTTTHVKTEIEDEQSSKLEAEEETSFDQPDLIDNEMMEFFDTLEDMEHPGVLCRLCGEPTMNPTYLYSDEDSDTEYSLADKINLCLPITVNAKDPLPKQLCPNCRERLNTCHKLAMTCLRTEDQLKAMLQMKKFHVTDESNAQCPLCVHGNMQAVIKSGIYRKESVENDPTTLKNSSARTREVTLSKNTSVKTEQWTSVDMQDSQSLEDTISDERVKNLSDAEDISTAPLPLLPKGELSCSICGRMEPDLHALKCHASFHSGLPCTVCENVNFNTVNEQKVHFMRHGITKDWCELCAAQFSSIDEAAEHIKTCGPEFWDVQCGRCGDKFPDVENEDAHACPVLEVDESLECDQCGKKFSRKLNLNTHMRSHQKREPASYRCSCCNKQFARKGSLHKHLSTVHDNIDSTVQPKCYKCNKCYEAFATAVSAETHITEKHFSQLIIADMNYISDQLTAEELNLTRVYTCEYCERCYTNPSSLHEHRRIEHTANSDYRCVVCDSSFESFKLLVNHKTLHGRTNQLEDLGIKQYYVCKYCNKTFLHYGTLTVHEGLHQPPDPYLCRLCNISFPTYEEVAVHRRTIHPYQSSLHERPNNMYHCQYCEKSFAHEVALIKHIRMHTGERPYKCSVCGKGFSQSSGLYTHLKVHSNLRPYTCPECPRTFKIKGDRDNHVKKHSGNRPYKCDFCEKAFMTQHVYSQHRKIHTNERPYKCDICGEAFRRSHVLTVHMRRHTGEKPHTCDLCPKAYRQRGDLLKHKRIQHGIGARHSNHILGISNHVLKSRLLNADSTSVLLPI